MGELHHLDVGCGDASVIKSSGATFLIDCHNISEHKHLLPNNKNLRGVFFITHQHRDHFSGLAFLKDNAYSIDCLIYSPYTRRRGDNSVEYEEWQEFESLMTHFKNKGTKTYTPYRQDDFKKPFFWSTNGIKFEIIGPHSSIAAIETREIHDASLVIKAVLGDRKCLFAGDASDANLKYIADNTKKTIVMISCMQAIMEVLMAPIWILSKKMQCKILCIVN